MIKANFNTYASYVTDSVYQWDINRVLSVSGLNLSVAPEVHFANTNMDKAIVRQATLENHIVSVNIPNSLLQYPLTINAYIGVYESKTFKVIETVSIPVIAKTKPSDYRLETSDEEVYSFEALKNAIANMVKSEEFNSEKANINARIDTIIANNNDTEGNTELIDIRTGYDGKTYRTSGSATRNQNEDIVNTLTRSGLYSETVLSGTNKTGKYVVKNSGLATETDQSTRGVIIYDVSAYAGKSVQISTVANSKTMFAYAIADSDNKVLEIVNGALEYKDVVSLPLDAQTLYVNYAISEAENFNVLVKVVDTVALPDTFDKIDSDILNANNKIDTLAKDGTLRLYLAWEFGGISTLGEIYSPDTIRIRTTYYYKPNFNSVMYDVPEGYRLLGVFYTYSEDTGEFVYSRHRGYATGSGEWEINEGEYVRFVLRGVEEIAFNGDEYKLLTLKHKAEALATIEDVKTMVSEYHPYNVPDYWVDTLEAKESEIKQIIFDAVSANNDVATFFTIADPHYPDNTGVSTSLMKYLSQKCGIGLTLCLGDLIADSKNSRNEGLSRIQDAMTNLSNMSDRMILTQGNHDTNIQIVDSDGEISAERIVYDGEWILHTSNKLLGLNKIVFYDNKKAFYYDDDILKIRFISIDSFENKSYEIEDGILKSLDLGEVSEKQAEWFANVLTNTPNDYAVVTFSHLAIEGVEIELAGRIFQMARGTMGCAGATSMFNQIRQFVKDGGNYICHFAGHLHHDFVSNFSSTFTTVVLLNDGLHWREGSYFGDYQYAVGDSPLKTQGTVSECAFDVVIVNKTTRHVDLIRVGAGDNRQFNY